MVGFEVFGVFELLGIIAPHFFVVRIELLEDVFQRLSGVGAITTNVAMTGRHIKLDAGDAGTILPSVMLFLHEEIELVQGVAG